MDQMRLIAEKWSQNWRRSPGNFSIADAIVCGIDDYIATCKDKPVEPAHKPRSILFYYSTEHVPGEGQTLIETDFGPVYIRAECLDIHYGDLLAVGNPREHEAVMNGHPAPGEPETYDAPLKRYLFLRTWTPEVGGDTTSEYVFVNARCEEEAYSMGGRHKDIHAAESNAPSVCYVTDYAVEIPCTSD